MEDGGRELQLTRGKRGSVRIPIKSGKTQPSDTPLGRGFSGSLSLNKSRKERP